MSSFPALFGRAPRSPPDRGPSAPFGPGASEGRRRGADPDRRGGRVGGCLAALWVGPPLRWREEGRPGGDFDGDMMSLSFLGANLDGDVMNSSIIGAVPAPRAGAPVPGPCRIELGPASATIEARMGNLHFRTSAPSADQPPAVDGGVGSVGAPPELQGSWPAAGAGSGLGAGADAGAGGPMPAPVPPPAQLAGGERRGAMPAAGAGAGARAGADAGAGWPAPAEPYAADGDEMHLWAPRPEAAGCRVSPGVRGRPFRERLARRSASGPKALQQPRSGRGQPRSGRRPPASAPSGK